ncbi:SDR family oxidoreductase [Caballeronia sp. DA-9]|uniref:SDR family oxidoreductase n=1 Tax=Caballeronia sp. DA-9 TaxID=3436237 RepID=UPI003F66E979
MPVLKDLGEQSPLGEDAFRQQLSALHRAGRSGEQEDIAWGIVYLACDEAKFVTGSELVMMVDISRDKCHPDSVQKSSV